MWCPPLSCLSLKQPERQFYKQVPLPLKSTPVLVFGRLLTGRWPHVLQASIPPCQPYHRRLLLPSSPVAVVVAVAVVGPLWWISGVGVRSLWRLQSFPHLLCHHRISHLQTTIKSATSAHKRGRSCLLQGEQEREGWCGCIKTPPSSKNT